MTSRLNRMIGEEYKRSQKRNEGVTPGVVKEVKADIISVKKSTENWFKKLFKSIPPFIRENKTDLKYLLLVIPIIAIFLVIRIIQNEQSLKTGAVAHSASISFQLASYELPPASTFGIWINSDYPVAFANIQLSFDPSLVEMTSEVSIVGALTRVVNVTSMTEANSTGKVNLILGLDPKNISSAPVGAFRIADIKFDTKTAAKNSNASISFTESSMQVAATDETVFSLTTTPLSLVLNPVATPTSTTTSSPIGTPEPTVEPTIEPTKSPTPKPTPTLTPRVTPTPTVTPVASPTPTATAIPTSVPTIKPHKPAHTSTPTPVITYTCGRCYRSNCDGICTWKDHLGCSDCSGASAATSISSYVNTKIHSIFNFFRGFKK